MKILQAFRFQLKLSCRRARELACFAGSARFVYNKALALQISRYEQGENKLTYAGTCKQLTLWRKNEDTIWLSSCHSQVLQQSLKDLERAYQNFFAKRAEFPRFKRKGVHDAFRFPQGVRLDQSNSRIFLPKLGWMRYRKSKEVVGEIGCVTISRRADKWYVSIQTEREVVDPVHAATTVVGVDMGVVRFATLSDRSIYEPVNSLRSNQKRLAAYQRKLCKKVKFSKNWKKAKTKIGRLHHTIANIRQDYLHKTTSAISKNHAIVCIEDLQIKNMSKSAVGTIALPGKNVKAKSGLNKAILDQGWYEFRRQLEYKERWLGGEVIAVSPHYTSQTCPDCDYVDSKNRQTQAIFRCKSCDYSENADYVSALNILRAGHAQLACGETVQLCRSMKQEPTEASQVLVTRAVGIFGL